MFKKILLISALAGIPVGLLLYYKRQADLLNSFKVDFFAYNVQDFTVEQMTIILVFKILNPTSIEGKISKGNIDIYLSANGGNERYAGNAYITTPQVIPAQGFNYIDVSVKVDNSVVVNDAILALGGSLSAPIAIHMVGTVNVKTGIIGVNIPIDDTEVTSIAQLAK